jgi:hypothetical protein
MKANITISGRKTTNVNIGGVRSFDSLTDTPARKTDSANKLVAVNAGETALEYIATPWTDLAKSDSELSGHSNQYIRVKLDESGLEFVSI